MHTTRPSVFGVYNDRIKLESAVDRLKSEGFNQSDISVMLQDQKNTQEFAQEKHTKAPEGATAGAGSGIVIGGTLGWLVGIGSLAIPGLGPFVAAGPIMSALAGAGVGGAVGTLTGALIGMGIPEYEAKKYEDALKQGGFLLSVHSEQPNLMNRAREILSETGAENISGSADAYSEHRTTQPGISETPGLRQERETTLETNKIDLEPGEEVVIGKDRIEKKRTA